jgi:hypothetical protein
VGFITVVVLIFFFMAGLLECTLSASVHWERKCIPFRRPAFSSHLLAVAVLDVVNLGGRNSEKTVNVLSSVRGKLREKKGIAGVLAQRGQERLDGNQPAGGTRGSARQPFTEQRHRVGRPVTSDGHAPSEQRSIGPATGAFDVADLILGATNRCFRFVRLIGSGERTR